MVWITNPNTDDSNNVYLTYYKLGIVDFKQKAFALILEDLLN